ncbi:MAG: hypothetical protein GEV03_08410 [Streptosporangiales bacterium]|nr:hypothetical protein [Streptosporangiales bacterium]
MNTLRDWTEAICLELNLDAAEVDRDLVLDLSRDVAHSVARPAAPLTAYLIGLAVGRGADRRAVADRVTELALHWASPSDATAEGGADRE